MDDILDRIDRRLSSLRCNPMSPEEEALIDCVGDLTEEVRRLRAALESALPISEDPK